MNGISPNTDYRINLTTKLKTNTKRNRFKPPPKSIPLVPESVSYVNHYSSLKAIYVIAPAFITIDV